MGNMGSMSSSYVTPGSSNFMSQPGPWWTAFGSGGLEGEPPLLEGIAAVWGAPLITNPMARTRHQLPSHRQQNIDSSESTGKG